MFRVQMMQKAQAIFSHTLTMELDHLGTIHTLRKHILGLFGPPPSYVSIFYVLKISKACYFLTPSPLKELTLYMNGPLVNLKPRQ